MCGPESTNALVRFYYGVKIPFSLSLRTFMSEVNFWWEQLCWIGWQVGSESRIRHQQLERSIHDLYVRLNG
jgi:hypothetical protein